MRDSRESVNVIEFAPVHMGLQLATGSSDGYVRIYVASDMTNLAHWQLVRTPFPLPPRQGGMASANGRPLHAPATPVVQWCPSLDSPSASN